MIESNSAPRSLDLSPPAVPNEHKSPDQASMTLVTYAPVIRFINPAAVMTGTPVGCGSGR